MEDKIIINMLSKADSVDGQGVGSAYIEQVNLIKNECADDFKIKINSTKKADIIHIHSINLGFYFTHNKGAVRVCYCHFLPETLDGSIKLPKLIFSIFKRYVIRFYKKAHYLIVVNPIFKKDLINLGIKEDHIRYIPNFVSKDKFYEIAPEEKIAVREKYNIPKDKFMVLGCGQIQTRKGVLDYVEVAKKNPDKIFVWAGGFSFARITDGYEELKKIVDNPPCENIIFLGIVPRTEMNGLFNAADCLFMPSYNELFPMSILEAVSSDTPVLVRDLDLYKDVLFDKYISGNNNEEFSMQINRLANDKDFYKECQEKSHYLQEFYSKDNVAKIWRDFYLEIHNNNPKRKNKKA